MYSAAYGSPPPHTTRTLGPDEMRAGGPSTGPPRHRLRAFSTSNPPGVACFRHACAPRAAGNSLARRSTLCRTTLHNHTTKASHRNVNSASSMSLGTLSVHWPRFAHSRSKSYHSTRRYHGDNVHASQQTTHLTISQPQNTLHSLPELAPGRISSCSARDAWSCTTTITNIRA